MSRLFAFGLLILQLKLYGVTCKRCHAPVVCSEGDTSSPEWVQVYPPSLTCERNNMVDGNRDSQGAVGERGPPGPPGKDGRPGTVDSSIVESFENEINTLKKKVEQSQTTIETLNTSLTKSITSLQESVNSDVTTLNAAVDAPNQAMQNFSSQLTQSIATLKSEMDSGFSALRTELTSSINQVQTSLDALKSKLFDREFQVLGNLPSANVRLTDGSDGNRGRVEVKYLGEWGTICDDSWTVNDGNVICRMLGKGTATKITTDAAEFGEGTGKIWLDSTDCIGTEANIGMCKHNGWGNHNCHHREDAGVVCSG